MKIFVAVPTYDGKLDVSVASCLMSEQTIAKMNGDVFQVKFLPGCSHPAMGRNQLVQDFLESDFDKIFFLDSDITWEPGMLTALCHFPKEFVGGVYRYKEEKEHYPVGWLPDPEKKGLWSDELGLIEVMTLPGGFCAISREAFGRIQRARPAKIYEHFGKYAYCHYEMPFDVGRLWGEDGRFCKDFREAGGKIYLKPDITLTHWDFKPTPFVGNLGKFLRANQNPAPEKAKEEPKEPVLECEYNFAPLNLPDIPGAGV